MFIVTLMHASLHKCARYLVTLYLNRNTLIYVRYINKWIKQLLNVLSRERLICIRYFVIYILEQVPLLHEHIFDIGITHCSLLLLSFVNPQAHYCLCFRGLMFIVVEIIYQIPIREMEKGQIWGAFYRALFFNFISNCASFMAICSF